MERLGESGAGFRSLTEAIDTTTLAGWMHMQTVGSFAEFERAMIALRMRSGRRRKHEHGGYAYGAPAFGYAAEARALVVNIVCVLPLRWSLRSSYAFEAVNIPLLRS